MKKFWKPPFQLNEKAKKLILTMKLTVLILFLTLMQVSATVYSQATRFSFRAENKQVVEVLRQIEENSDFRFFFLREQVDVERKVTVTAREATVEQILDELFRGQPVSYEFANEALIVLTRSDNPLGSVNSFLQGNMQQPAVSGTVIDESGQPLPGVTVVIKGTTQGTVTNADGNYSLTNIPENATLVFSFVGMQKQEIAVGNQTNLNVRMEEETIGIDEVVAIGYGTVRKIDLTGSVASVKTKNLENLPSSRVDQLLQGRAAGVYVTTVDGSPSARSTIRIRGGNSIIADNEPLYVIDGFIVGTGFNLSNLNVNDIESIDILKDATAVSIYGTRGANGVILITTKTGDHLAMGKPDINVNFYTGFSKMVRKIDYLSGPERAEFGSEAAALINETDPWADPNEIVADTDWQELVSQAANTYNLDFSITGRNQNLNYYVSFNNLNQQGILRETGVKRYNLRTNFDLKFSDRVKVGLRLNSSLINSDNEKVNLWGMREALTAFPVYNPDGSFNTENIVTGGILNNPEAILQLTTDFTYSTNLLSMGYIEFEILKGLILKSSIGPKLNWSKRNEYYDSNLPARKSKRIGGLGRVTNNFDWDILQENTLTYSKEFNENHKFDILAGFTWQKGHRETFSGSSSGIFLDALKYHDLSLGSQETFELNTGFQDAKQLVSWIGRTNYIYRNRYLFTLVGRVDGSSVYSGANNTYAFFPSASFAWRMNEEPFIKNLNLFNNLKFKVSYGNAGKESIDPYRTLSVLMGDIVIFNKTQAISITKGRPSNTDLKWETTSQLDVGLEAGFFKGRLNFETNYYHKKTRDLLLEKRIPTMTGFNTKLENVGSIQNKGVELLINSVNFNTKKFNWSSTLTLSGNRSKVIDLANVESIIIYDLGGPAIQLIEGEPVGIFTGIEYIGTYKNQEEIDEDGPYGLRQMVGGPRYKDTNGDGILNNADHKIIGNPEPIFYGGLNNSFGLGNFQLDIYLQGTYGNEILNEYSLPGFFGRTTENVYAELRNRWTPENPTSDIPRAGTMASYTDVRTNTKLIEDGSHLRLKSVKLTYSIPTENLNLHWLKNIDLYVAGTNLALLSNFRGYDPEVNRFGTDAVIRGVARAEYPNSRTFNFGIKAIF